MESSDSNTKENHKPMKRSIVTRKRKLDEDDLDTRPSTSKSAAKQYAVANKQRPLREPRQSQDQVTLTTKVEKNVTNVSVCNDHPVRFEKNAHLIEEDDPNPDPRSSTSKWAANEQRLLEESSCSLTTVERNSLNASLSQSLLGDNLNRCGKILSIHLTNFMCHSNLVVKFSPRVNFLVGSNGSGKSAIMAAIVLGLGARAKCTNRSTNMKKFIKAGEVSAKIEIVFSNEGLGSYEREKYGDEITVVRTINQSVATYAIKSKEGRVVSKKFDDLQRILLYHNMQVDNPALVLNQDLAREFLKKMDPISNYRLFLKATQIELIEEKLNETLILRQNNKLRLDQLKKKLERSQLKLSQQIKKLEQLNSEKELQRKLTDLEAQSVWLNVNNLEAKLQEISNRIKILQTKKDEIKYSLKNKSEQAAELKQTVTRLESELSTLSNEYRQENGKHNELKMELRRRNEQCGNIAMSINTFKKNIGSWETECNELDTYIKEKTHDNEEDKSTETNEEKLAKCRLLMAENKLKMANAARDQEMLMENRFLKEENVGELKLQLNKQKGDLENISFQIASIQQKSDNTLAIYGTDAVRFHAELLKMHRARCFTAMPKGPIGTYIQVPNPKYRDVTENQLNHLLQAYIVNAASDCKQIQAKLRTDFPHYQLTIITTRFTNKVYDVSEGAVQPPENTNLLMNEIRCKDAVVMNCLIDQARIEGVLLVDNVEIAEFLTSYAVNVPNNLFKVVVVPQSMEYYPDPHYRMYSITVRPARLIQVDVKERIEQLKQGEIKLLQTFKESQQKLSVLMAELAKCIANINEKRKLQDEQRNEYRKLDEKIADLNEATQENETDVLKKELDILRAKINQVNKNLNEKGQELDDAKLKVDLLKSQITEHQTGMESMRNDIAALKKKQDEARERLRGLDTTDARNQSVLRELNTELKELNHNKTLQMDVIKDAIIHANTFGERVTTTQTIEELHNAIHTIKTKIAKRKCITEAPHDLEKQIQSFEKIIKNDTETFEYCNRAIMQLDTSMKARFAYMRAMKQYMAMMLHHSFDLICRIRNYVGAIHVDHKAKTLTITVVPRDGHLENAVSSTKSLSGGERSYSTVAFLISLWSCVDHPFYILDEYDVFTDEVNRKNITHMLIKEGKDHPKSQYIFLTPQAMRLQSDDVIQIHKLAVPKLH